MRCELTFDDTNNEELLISCTAFKGVLGWIPTSRILYHTELFLVDTQENIIGGMTVYIILYQASI
jgi:hypothetical protein